MGPRRRRRVHSDRDLSRSVGGNVDSRAAGDGGRAAAPLSPGDDVRRLDFLLRPSRVHALPQPRPKPARPYCARHRRISGAVRRQQLHEAVQRVHRRLGRQRLLPERRPEVHERQGVRGRNQGVSALEQHRPAQQPQLLRRGERQYLQYRLQRHRLHLRTDCRLALLFLYRHLHRIRVLLAEGGTRKHRRNGGLRLDGRRPCRRRRRG